MEQPAHDVGHAGSTATPGSNGSRSCHTRFGIFPECPLCDGPLTPEHAHFKCRACGWRDSCCD